VAAGRSNPDLTRLKEYCMAKQEGRRRALVTGLGLAAAAVGATPALAQSTAAPFTPARHALDAWLGEMPGKHRVVLDVTSPEHIPEAIRFTGNLYTGNKNGYDLDEGEVAIAIVLRHGATAYGYGDGMWSKYGKQLDSKAATPPTANPFNSGERMQLSGLAKRGVQFMVCGTASRNLANRLAGADGNGEAVFKEMGANLIPSARIVPAGVVGVSRAQEYGFSYIYVG
jgi:intracellular sulfur oxidation DsrE/DsrF family protein